jgi:hypothetical protein
MTRWSMVVGFLFVLACSSPALAEMPPGEHRNGGLGFHNVEAPVGVRWWLAGQKIGFDLGFGYSTSSAEPAGFPDEQLSDWAFDLGVPFVIHSWSHAHVLLRPGILYVSEEEVVGPGPGFDTDSETTLTVAAEIEAEVFLVDNFSVSASTGIGFVNFDPVAGDNQTSFTTIGRNFTTVGFHVYFFGSSE